MIKINGGATVWARQTIDSEIFYNKPDVWFKIWFYLVNQVKHKDDKRFKRGSCFLKYEWIMDKTGATKNQVKHCIEFLKKDKMLATQKATRGFVVKVNKYNDYQTLDNYKKPQEKESKRNTEGTQKEHRSHTINNTLKNVNNVNKRTILEKWLNYRKSMKKPVTNEATLKLLVKRFNAESIEKIEWTVNLSIENNYQGLFWDKYSNPLQSTSRGTRRQAVILTEEQKEQYR